MWVAGVERSEPPECNRLGAPRISSPAAQMLVLFSHRAWDTVRRPFDGREPDMTDFFLGSNRIAKHRAASNCVRIFGDRL